MENTLMFTTKEEIRLGRLLRFIIPTYLTSLFTTLYTIVDGLFVAACVGTNALAAINIVYPIVNVLEGISLGLAAGGSALAALDIGASKKQKACQTFTICIAAALGLGGLIALLILANFSWVLDLLGATDAIRRDCEIYAFWWLIGSPVVMLKSLLIHFIRTDGSPGFSFLSALSGGIANLVLDELLIARLHMGIRGAALATCFGMLLTTGMGMLYFVRKTNWLKLTGRGLSWIRGFRCLVNGMSEWVDQIAVAITTVVFNRSALFYAGEDGVAAISILMYLQFLVIGIYYGFSKGLAIPLGYACGRKVREVCRRLETIAYCFFCTAPLFYGLTYILAPAGVHLFAAESSPVYSLAISGMRWYGLSFLFSGLNIFCEIRLGAYGSGHVSGIITGLRSFLLLLLFLQILPPHMGMLGIWLAVPCAEGVTMLVSVALTGYDWRIVRHPGWWKSEVGTPAA